MRVVFAGTPEFARAALERLHAAGFMLPLVLTQPDRPAGRGMKLQPSPVKQFAQAHGPAERIVAVDHNGNPPSGRPAAAPPSRTPGGSGGGLRRMGLRRGYRRLRQMPIRPASEVR